MANNKKLQIAFIGGGMIANAHMRDFHDAAAQRYAG
jgi:hypothetical protein